MICYEDGKLPVMVTLVLCVPLNYITFFMVSDLTFSTVIYCEACKFPFITHWFCASLCYLSFFMISDLMYCTVICYKVGKFPIEDNVFYVYL